MIKRNSNYKFEIRENMRGGNGNVKIEHLFDYQNELKSSIHSLSTLRSLKSSMMVISKPFLSAKSRIVSTALLYGLDNKISICLSFKNSVTSFYPLIPYLKVLLTYHHDFHCNPKAGD